MACLEPDYQCRYKTTTTSTATVTTGNAGGGAVVGGVVGGLLFLLVLVASVIAVRKSKSNANGRRADGNGNRTVVVASITNPGFVGAGAPNAAKHGQQQRTKVRITNPQSPYSEAIYADIEEEIYVCAGGEIQALTAQASSAGVRNPSSMAGSLDDRLANVIDGVVSMLASVGQPTTRAAVERRLEATLPREASGGGEHGKELEDAQRANAKLQRKIAELQATRALPSVPGDRNASAERGGGTARATYASSSSGTAVPAAPIYATYAPLVPEPASQDANGGVADDDYGWPETTTAMCARGLTSGGRACSYPAVSSGQLYCHNHACPHGGCGESKSSADPACAKHLPQGVRPRAPTTAGTTTATAAPLVPELAHQDANGGVADHDNEWPVNT